MPQCACGGQRTFWDCFFSFTVDSGDWIQVIRLGCQAPLPDESSPSSWIWILKNNDNLELGICIFLGKQCQDTILILPTVMKFLMDFMVSFKTKIDKREWLWYWDCINNITFNMLLFE